MSLYIDMYIQILWTLQTLISVIQMVFAAAAAGEGCQIMTRMTPLPLES